MQRRRSKILTTPDIWPCSATARAMAGRAIAIRRPAGRASSTCGPRSHNTPRNHRVIVTRTARRLLDDGAKSLQITLVVIGADYCAENELLRLEGVSLNFLD